MANRQIIQEPIWVLKRDGSRARAEFDQIGARLADLARKDPPLQVDPVLVELHVVRGLVSGMHTSDIDVQAAEEAANMCMEHPDYGKLAGRILVSDLHKTTSPSFVEAMRQAREKNLNKKTGKTHPLISDETWAFIQEHAQALDAAIDHEADYSFDVFACATLKRAYLLKAWDGKSGKIIERPQYMYMRSAIATCAESIEMALATYKYLSGHLFTFATPTLYNSGTPWPQLSSCFLMVLKDDSIEGIYDTIKDTAIISKNAGGIGVSVHNVRAAGSYIGGSGGTSNGLVPMLRVFNDTARYVDQGGGKRKGAFAIYLEPWHADIFAVLDLKKNHGKEELRARDLFYAMWVPDLFMKRVRDKGTWSLFCPAEAPGLADVWGDEFEKLYEKYEATPGLAREKIPANDLMRRIIESQIETGGPYMLYKDAVNRKSNQKHLGTIKSSNLCVAGDTLILTSKGHLPIQSLANQQVDVWNGFEFSTVTVHQTGREQQLVRVAFSNGATLDCTPYHKFYVMDGYASGLTPLQVLAGKKRMRTVEAQHLTIGDKLVRHELPVVELAPNPANPFAHPYTHGFFCGDGLYALQEVKDAQCSWSTQSTESAGIYCGHHADYDAHHNAYQQELARRGIALATKDSRGKPACQAWCGHMPRALLYGEKKLLLEHLATVSVRDEPKYDRISVGLPPSLRPKFDIPMDQPVEIRLRWFAGYCDADGTVVRNEGSQGLQVSSILPKFLESVRLMLQTLGVESKVCKSTNGGMSALPANIPSQPGATKEYLQQPLYRLLVAEEGIQRLLSLGFSPRRLVLTVRAEPYQRKTRFVQVTAVEPLPGAHDTFCFTEPKLNAGIFNGILTSQCVEVALFTSPEEVAVCLTADTLVETRQGPRRIDECDGAEVLVPFSSDDVQNMTRQEHYEPVTLIDNGLKPVLRITTAGSAKPIKATVNHRFLVKLPDDRLVWKRADTIMPGSRIVCGLGSDVPADTRMVLRVESLKEEQVYDLSVPNGHHFVADGLVVHNCNLASVSLKAFYDATKTDTNCFDYEKLYECVYHVAQCVDNEIDATHYPIPQARTSNLRHRPIGLGVQGLQELFYKLRIPYDSQEASDVQEDIFETMAFAALTSSCDTAKVRGYYPSFPGSPTSKGILQMDMWEQKPRRSGRHDWEALRADIVKYGLRNSQLMAPMPTASTSIIMGNTEGFEPVEFNVQVRGTLAGDYQVVNRSLVEELMSLGLWTQDVRASIMAANGSVQHLMDMPEKTRLLFKNASEISNRRIIDMAAARGKYICQSNSMNLNMKQPTIDKVYAMHMYGWSKGLKTGMYYLRTRGASDPIKFTVDPSKVREQLANSPAPSRAIAEDSKEDEDEGFICKREPGCDSCGS